VSPRPALLLYCQHSVGLGHLARSLALAEGLAERFDVTLLSGGTMPDGVTAPAGVELVALPPLAMTAGKLVSRVAGHTVEDAFALRRETLLAALRSTRPAAVVIEMFPFGRKKFAAELVPLLQAADAMGARPLVACSLRDILVSRGDEQADYDDRASRTANQHFDAVLLHADPHLVLLEESFRPRVPLRVPVHYTGYVVPGADFAPAEHREGIIVSAGGGVVGGELMRAALDAHRLLWPQHRVPMRLIAGPFLPEAEWEALRADAERTEGAEAIRSVPNLRAELAGAAASVSQCGYNTAFDLLRSRVPALVVPYAEPGEDEQTRRARRLEDLGALRTLAPERLAGPALAAALGELFDFRPRATGLRLDGARETAELLAHLVTQRTEMVA
jgi:predicted glycosyltransferase